jgi:putative aldouronate transport system permease protein
MVTTRESKQVRIHVAKGDRAFYTASTALLTLLFISVLYPIIFVVSASFSEGRMVSAGKVVLWPVNFSLEGYEAVFRNSRVLSGYLNTIRYTLIGTLINVSVCMICAYPMSRRDLPGRNFFMLVFTFTMYFSGGMIPNYILMRNLGILNTTWVMVLPGALSVYNMILARTFMQSSIPGELMEAAILDGCSDIRYFVKIVLPLSKAIIAVIVMYSAVGHWNMYFNAMLYLNSADKMPLQIVLREILLANQFDASMLVDPELQQARADLADVLKYALILVSTVPILCMYPFVQRYFVQGVMIGSIKG